MQKTLTRRSFLTRKKAKAAAPVTAAAAVSSLTPYTGAFGFEQAAHLLRRTTFGPTKEQINLAASQGLDNVLAFLLQDLPLPAPPVIYFGDADPNAPVGSDWTNAPYISNDNEIVVPRVLSLRAWSLNQMVEEGLSIREKMTLFWHNHFVTANINDPKFTYHYFTQLRENALGNFRELAKIMTVNPSMLRYLNGNQNTKNAPNENYARELLELFTLGKGPQVAPGDYTTYTEDDVIACAKILTGWRDRGFFTDDPDQAVTSQYINNRHDLTDKQLSHRFDNIIVAENGEDEYKDLIDIIFDRTEPAYFIARKLYRWFVYYVIDEQVEIDVIAPLAEVILENDYDIKPALEALFGSEHFFDVLNFGPMIKNPTDFMVSAIKVNKIDFPGNVNARYAVQNQIAKKLEDFDMPLFDPPSVAGYPAYYQAPGYYRIWVNSATLPHYNDMVTKVAGPGIAVNNFMVRIDVLARVQELDNPGDPNALIDELATVLFPQGITEGQRTYLKNFLIPGLPDFEWTVEYGMWAEDPDDSDLTAAIENKLRALWSAMVSMPEYFLS